MYTRFAAEIEQLNQQVLEQPGQRPTAGLLMTHPGVGPITALATDVFLGDPKRFRDGQALASYIGIIPREHSSGGRQRLGDFKGPETLQVLMMMPDGIAFELTSSNERGAAFPPQRSVSPCPTGPDRRQAGLHSQARVRAASMSAWSYPSSRPAGVR
jgi:hypothetical protein